MHDLQIPILLPRPIKPSPLPRRKIRISLVYPSMPAPAFRKLNDAALDALPLLFLRYRRCGPIFRPERRRLVEAVAADNAAHLSSSVWDLVHETMGAAFLDELGGVLRESVVERE